MIRFVGNDAEGLPLKRKQSQRACEQCRKRKKRCPHQTQPELSRKGNSNVGPGQPTTPRTSIRGTRSPQRPSRETKQARMQVETEPAASEHQHQFLSPPTAGSLNTTLTSGNVIDVEEEELDSDPRFVGELNPEGIFVAHASPAGAPTAAVASSSPQDIVGIWVPRGIADAAKSLTGPILPVLLPYLEAQCSEALPGSIEYDQLYQLYLDEYHPVLPIINIESYQRQQGVSKLLLNLAVCLCVASSPKSSRYLKQPPREFTGQVTQLLRSAIDNGLIRDRQISMQLFVILAQSTQLSDNRHASAEFTCRAVCTIQTGGLHLDTSMHRSDSPYMARLFCCVFVLDRLNAAVQGRPVLMHERDIGRDMEVCVKQQDSLFQLLLRVILLLGKVIALYRPGVSTVGDKVDGNRMSDIDFPTFEDLLGACGTIRAPAPLIATVETLYHAVAMLSCRSQSLSEISNSSASHSRQKLSAASITSIAGNEYRGRLSVFPFVPYAMSLALRVCYRDLRLSRSPFTRARARRQLLHVCTLLRELGNVFSSSVRMAEMAEQMVREMDKAYTNMAGQRRGSMAPTTSDAIQHETQTTQTMTTTTTTTMMPRGPEPSAQHTCTSDNLSTPAEIPMIAEPINETNNHDMQAFDPALFDFDLDIFDHFDPEFDIGAIDAALANTIDPAMSGDAVYWDTPVG